MTGTWQQNAAVSEPVRQRSVSAIQVLFNAINKDEVCMPVNMKKMFLAIFGKFHTLCYLLLCCWLLRLQSSSR